MFWGGGRLSLWESSQRRYQLSRDVKAAFSLWIETSVPGALQSPLVPQRKKAPVDHPGITITPPTKGKCGCLLCLPAPPPQHGQRLGNSSLELER